MQRGLFLLTSVIILFFCSMLFLSQCNRSEEAPENQQSSAPANQQQPTPELADYMSQLQQYTHKFALSVDAENEEAAAFYFHEIRALTDVIQKDVPGYEGYDIARFIDIFLKPEILPVNDALVANDWQETRSGLITLVDACNTCHRATSHGFIQVTPGFDKNPYNQVFDTQ